MQLCQLRLDVGRVVVTENFRVSVQNQPPAIRVALPFGDQLYVNFRLPEPPNQVRPNAPLREMGKAKPLAGV